MGDYRIIASRTRTIGSLPAGNRTIDRSRSVADEILIARATRRHMRVRISANL
jgi:hypothetical protein